MQSSEPLRRVEAGEVLVAGEHAVGEAVVFVERGKHLGDAAAVGFAAGDDGPDGRGLDGLAVVDAVGGERSIAEAVVFAKLDEVGGDALRVLEVGEVGLPVEALLVQEAGKVEQLGVAGAVVQPEDDEGVILPAELAPVAQGAGGEARRAGGRSSADRTGMTRGSPVASSYWARTLSMTMRGHQSLLLGGPIMPSGAWWVRVQSM